MKNSATKGLKTTDASSRVVTAPRAPMKNPSVKGMTAAPMRTPAATTAKLPNGTDWAAHHDHQTLMDAEHIKADPVKMHKVRQVAGRKLMAATAINNIADIKTAAKKLRAGKLEAAGANPTEPAKRFPSGEMDPEGVDHHNTLERAEMIKASPAKMEGVARLAAAKMHAASAVADSVYGKGPGNKDYDQDND